MLDFEDKASLYKLLYLLQNAKQNGDVAIQRFLRLVFEEGDLERILNRLARVVLSSNEVQETLKAWK